MIETKIPKIDEFFNGGIPTGKTLVLYGCPGVDFEIFGMQILYNTLKSGKTGVFVASGITPEAVRSKLKDFGWDITPYNDNFYIVDSFSNLIGAASNEEFVVDNPEDIESINKTIESVFEKIKPELIVFGSLSTIMDYCGEEKTLEIVKEWNTLNLLYDSVCIYNFTAWPYSEETLDIIKNDLFNSTIYICGIAERVIFGQYFSITKSDWSDRKIESVIFKVSKPYGIKIYIPKILVTGPYNAGKSTFIHAISNKSVSVDRFGTTVALDHGFIDYKGFIAEIFGTPGQERFDPIIEKLGGEAMGVFLIMDSTKPNEFIRAKRMLEITKSHGLPYVIVANKQDLPGALKIDEIRERFKLPDDVPIIPAIAHKKIGVFEAFEKLVDKITGGF